MRTAEEINDSIRRHEDAIKDLKEALKSAPQPLTISLTEDERKWLRMVITHGAEITNQLANDRLIQSSDIQKWNAVQFNLYCRRVF
jgi:hypothetical protein